MTTGLIETGEKLAPVLTKKEPLDIPIPINLMIRYSL